MTEVQNAATHEPPVSKGYKDIATIVEGTHEGRPVTLRMDTWAWPHEKWGMSGGKLMVASPPAIVGRWLASGRLDKPGVWAPEQIVDGEPFFAELAERGMGTSMDRQKTLH